MCVSGSHQMQLKYDITVTSSLHLLARASCIPLPPDFLFKCFLSFVIFPFIFIFYVFDFYFNVVFSQIAVTVACAAIFVIIL